MFVGVRVHRSVSVRMYGNECVSVDVGVSVSGCCGGCECRCDHVYGCECE